MSEAPERTKQKSGKGLRASRSGQGKKPTFQCDNCKCMRYGKCGCQRKEK